MTSIYEACWTSFRFGKDNVLPKSETYTTDRRLFQAKAASERACDLSDQRGKHPELVHPYDYSLLPEPGGRDGEGRASPLKNALRAPGQRHLYSGLRAGNHQ